MEGDPCAAPDLTKDRKYTVSILFCFHKQYVDFPFSYVDHVELKGMRTSVSDCLAVPAKSWDKEVRDLDHWLTFDDCAEMCYKLFMKV